MSKPIPEEITIGEAIRILGVSRQTVIKYMESGAIRVRNVAPPQSLRKCWRLLKEDVISIRTNYGTIVRKPIYVETPVVSRDEEPLRFMKRKKKAA